MAKKLSLLRHAKASYEVGLDSDSKRILTESGRLDAQKLAYKLRGRNTSFDQIWVSSAERCLQSLEIIQKILGIPQYCIQPKASLYTANAAELLRLVQKCSDNHKHLLIIGHNPCLTNAINQWAYPDNLDFLPPAGFVELSVKPENWAQFGDAKASISWFDFPANDYLIV